MKAMQCLTSSMLELGIAPTRLFRLFVWLEMLQ